MTLERKIVLGLDEIKAIVFECSSAGCGARVVLPPDAIDNIPTNCPGRHAWNWADPKLIERAEQSNSKSAPLVSFLQSLRRLRDPLVQESAGFKISLELDEPKL